ncbi:MAG: glycosyltransferase family 39 protein [Patescibacteria group bacterium]|nr:glycosyltransferase family 39 protein [Patescibacteria group bacterium]
MTKKIFLIIVFIIALFLRTVNIGSNPAGFTWDEAALGYNAYSILQTGKDEWGQSFPLIFKSFGDYKPGFYVYLDIPFVAFLGLNELSTRLPSIILGSLVPLIAFALVRQLLPKDKQGVGMILAVLLAISPWAIQFSRGAWEANVAFVEILLAIYFLLQARHKNKGYLFMSVALFGLSIYTYQSAKLLAVLLLASLILVYRQYFLKKSVLVFNTVLLIVFIVILFSSMADPIARSRLAVLNQYSYHRSDTEISGIKKEENITSVLQFQFFHSEQLEYLRTISGRYLNYFSPKFLFTDGPQDGRQGVQGYGVMHLFELPFFLAGIYFLLRKHRKEAIAVILLTIFAPIPAALSRDVVSTVRSLPLVFALEFFSAVGIFYVFSALKNRQLFFYLAGLTLALVTIFNLGFYLDQLFVHFPIASSQYYLHGYREAVNFVQQNQGKYKSVVFTTKYNEPYIFYLFYTKYDPKKFQQQATFKGNGLDVGEVPKIDNIEFRPIYWPDDRSIKDTLFVGTGPELPDQDIDPKQSTLLETIKFLDKETAFKIAATK